ncbi:4-(cytidine 5'-diphospho)-2-C-methyl-D-erythritol kinase [Synoicihabitans lomoniglobus]|uniref:4-diphosphocytidyl-2-C-methyl-D-erythritol kinase n=1 Tax=Synoicihabitans lomoniglobus TaxID=2909285 RepID=A0AAF0CSX3_9BACT|nr:4-(cytidine 5'-diphospho)-2-C-methyl-D-erythritol kinase [Opitutaceae bacterium LMO-M01]WED67474.1 4-(cytidine 5'-diphospho)-2-C-methyl-D-erythritol kinase [Opitutaceae bacterium LMO-M01]
MDTITQFCPAKINLFLAITGRRDDGFHELVSVVAPLAWGDTLEVDPAADGKFTLDCDDPAVPRGEDNLILQAARAFATASGWRGGARFTLTKRVPMGAGLGGGSSDAVGALRALNELAGAPLEREALAALAARVGSDCPLFLYDGPVVMRGRGERIDPLSDAGVARLRDRSLLVFKPAFGIGTVWSYQQLAASAPGSYLPSADAEERLAIWQADASASAEALGFNSLERPAFAKFVALPVMLAKLQREHGLNARMSGSGSACFAWLSPEADAEAIRSTIRAGWGDTAMVQMTTVRTKSAANPH